MADAEGPLPASHADVNSSWDRLRVPKADLGVPRMAESEDSLDGPSDGTAAWCASHVPMLQAEAGPWDWKSSEAYVAFRGIFDAPTPPVDPGPPAPMTFRWPRSRADTRNAVRWEMVDLAWAMGHDSHWLRKDQIGLPEGADTALEPINEVPRWLSKRSPAQGSGVPVDQILIAEAFSSNGHPRVVSSTGEHYRYLDHNEEYPDGVATRVAAARLIYRKALLAIRVQRFGELDADKFRDILQAGRNIGAPTDAGSSYAAERAIIQEAVRCSHELKTPYLFISDYHRTIILKVPTEAELRAAEAVGEEAPSPLAENASRLKWAIVEDGEEKIALAYLLWLGCDHVKLPAHQSIDSNTI